MKKRIALLMVVVSLLLVPVAVVAQGDGTNSSSGELEPVSEPAVNPANLEAARERLNKRLDERRSEIANRLNAARSRLLAQRCEAVQSVLQTILRQATALHESRTALYGDLTRRIDALLIRLQVNHEVDVTDLGELIEDLKTDIEAFMGDLETYIAALEGAATTADCQDNPTEFHEYLETARELRTELRKSSRQIKAVLGNELKNALADIRSQLSAETGGEAES